MAFDERKQLDGPAQFSPETTDETTIPHNKSSVERALGETTETNKNMVATTGVSARTTHRENTTNCNMKSRDRDSDNDHVNNFLECSYGLDEAALDTDGDTLTDAEELLSVTEDGTPIPESNPRHKDIYLIIGLSEGAYIDAGEIVSLFDNFDVSNPNGEGGINLHFETRELNETARSGNYQKHKTRYRTNLTGETDVYRGLLVTTGENDSYLGRASIYLNFAVTKSGREVTATHEILHLVVGKIPETDCENPYHNCHGETMLSPQLNENNWLSDNTTTHIERTGLGPQRNSRRPDPISQCKSFKNPLRSCTDAATQHHDPDGEQ